MVSPSLQRKSIRLCLCVAAVLVFAGSPVASAEQPWPGFRGPKADGLYSASTALSQLNNVSLEVVWKKPLGSGYSGVSVAQGYAVTMYSDGKHDLAAAYDTETGQQRWTFEIDKTYEGHDGSHTGPIATPFIHKNQVIGLAPRGRLFALALKTGKLLWSTDLQVDHKAKKPHYGFSSSPIVMEGVLVVQVGSEGGAVFGFDPATGEKLWQVGEDTVAYQSPIPLTLAGQLQVVAAGDKKLLGVNVKTGKLLWEYEHGGGGATGAGSVTPVSLGDGHIFFAHKGSGSAAIAMKTDGEGLSWDTLWEDRSIKNSYNVPVFYDGYLYAFSSRLLVCVNADDGKLVWRSRAPGDGFITIVDGHLVIATKKGGLHIAKATPEGYDEIASLALFDDLIWSPSSFANDSIYVRSMGEIARVRFVTGGHELVAHGEADVTAKQSAFGRLLAELEKTSDKKSVVDRFMASTPQLPLIENGNVVRFIYRGEAKDVALASDLIGGRLEQSMTRVAGTDLFYYASPLEPDARVNYHFIKNYEEAVLDPKNPRQTTTHIYTKTMELSFGPDATDVSWFAMPNWREPSYLRDNHTRQRGKLVSHELESEILEAKHTIQVYLPNGYDENERRYPVAYIYGGKGALDDGQYQLALDNLIGSKIAPLVAVFVLQSPGRDNEKFAKMIAAELVPFVDGEYRTLASAANRASVAAGMASSAALYTSFKHADVFGKIGLQSAFPFSSFMEQFRPLIAAASSKPVTVYLEWGKYDMRSPSESWGAGELNRKLVKLLQDYGITTIGGEVHDGTGWSSWRNRTDNMLSTLFPLEN